MLTFFFRLFNDRQAVFPTQSVIDFPDCLVGIPVVVEFMSAVQSGAVKFDMTVDMALIHMGSNKELMLPAGELQSKLIPQLVRVLW